MDVAPTSFPSGWLASVQLPRHRQLRHLHPSSAPTLEPRGLCCILATELISDCAVLRFEYEATLLVCLVYAPGQDKDFVVWAVCSGFSHPKQTASVFRGLCLAEKT